MKETTWILDAQTGALTIEGFSQVELTSKASDLLPQGVAVNCARPLHIPPVNSARREAVESEAALRIFRIYHGSVVEGPGRRSVAQLAGCELRCPGCFVPETHPRASGTTMYVSEVVRSLLADEGTPRDGVTILGGEPFLQPEGLRVLVQMLKQHNQHVTIYSGYTFEQLLAREDADLIRDILDQTDVLVDGPFVKALAGGAGEWRGSSNQRILLHPIL